MKSTLQVFTISWAPGQGPGPLARETGPLAQGPWYTQIDIWPCLFCSLVKSGVSGAPRKLLQTTMNDLFCAALQSATQWQNNHQHEASHSSNHGGETFKGSRKNSDHTQCSGQAQSRTETVEIPHRFQAQCSGQAPSRPKTVAIPHHQWSISPCAWCNAVWDRLPGALFFEKDIIPNRPQSIYD